MHAEVGVVIVNWNAGSQLRECIQSVQGTEAAVRLIKGIVVVDNASDDGSIDTLSCPTIPLKIVRNPVNRGFAAACNQGARLLCGQYVLFVNPDTRVTSGSVARAVGEIQREGKERVGIVGLQLRDGHGFVTRTCCRLPTSASLLWELTGLDRVFKHWPLSYRMRDFDHLSSREVDHVIGAFFLVRREVFDSLGGFDERFFVYFEDLDFSWRARQAGWRSWFAAEGSGYHKGGGCSERVPGERLFYSWCGRILFAQKHFNRLTSGLVLLSTLSLEPALRLMKALLTLSLPAASATLVAYGHLLRSLRSLALGADLRRRQGNGHDV